MTKSEINQKLAELRAQGEALQQNNTQIMQLLSDMLSELEKPPVEGENGEAEKNADKKDNG